MDIALHRTIIIVIVGVVVWWVILEFSFALAVFYSLLVYNSSDVVLDVHFFDLHRITSTSVLQMYTHVSHFTKIVHCRFSYVIYVNL